jgi:hypothetical protein
VQKDIIKRQKLERDLQLVKDAFVAIFGREGRGFGTNATPFRKGVSDDNDGVQWNFVVDENEGVVKLGVNLEGMEYDHWPIARFIEKELADPASGLPALSHLYSSDSRVLVRMVRDAWQVTARPPIQEKIIGSNLVPLSELTPGKWEAVLLEAYDCLDGNRNHRGRAEQVVTLVKSGEQVSKPVSPHLTISTPLWVVGQASLQVAEEKIKQKMDYIRPIYDHVVNMSSQESSSGM